MQKKIDYLSEDKPIPSQSYALVSIVGPGMKAKCDVYGLKIRGICGSLDEGKAMSKNIMEYDNMFDIYTVPVGKFFPLDVSDDKSVPVEYQDEELNKLMKSYMESTQNANKQWKEQQEVNVKKAQEPKSQEKEHVYTVYNTILNVKAEIEKIEKELREKHERLVQEEQRMTNEYTTEQRDSLARYISKEMTTEESKEFLG
jgi:hypothetical protein